MECVSLTRCQHGMAPPAAVWCIQNQAVFGSDIATIDRDGFDNLSRIPNNASTDRLPGFPPAMPQKATCFYDSIARKSLFVLQVKPGRLHADRAIFDQAYQVVVHCTHPEIASRFDRDCEIAMTVRDHLADPWRIE